MMGGEIRVESEENKGATFYYTLPLIQEETFSYSSIVEKTEKNDRQLTNWQGKTILIAEDEPVNFYFIKEALKSTGVEFIHAQNGIKAIEAVKENPTIDLVLMDIKMPEMNGFEATKIIKKLRKNLPIIAQTAFAMEEDKKNCLDAGCDDYIAKPIRNKDLMGILSGYFG